MAAGSSKRSFDGWMPAQETQPEAIDFRNAKTGPRGYKVANKRKATELQDAPDTEDMMLDTAAAAAAAAAAHTDDPMEEGQQSSKRRKAEGAKYIPIYDREVKAPKERASKVMKPAIKTSWEQKMKEKASKQMFQEQKKAAETVAKDKKKAIGLQRKNARERKEANKAKSVVVQKITNNATLKKMMKNKKQKKLLRKADTN